MWNELRMEPAHSAREPWELRAQPDNARPALCLTSAELICLQGLAPRQSQPGCQGHRSHGAAVSGPDHLQSHPPFPPWAQEILSPFQHPSRPPLRGQLNQSSSPEAILKTGQQSSGKLQRLSVKFQMTRLQERLNLSLCPFSLPCLQTR